MADFNLGTSLTQNWDARGRVFYTDENGNKVDLNTPFLERVGNRLKAMAFNAGRWLTNENTESQDYKDKVSSVTGLVTMPFGMGNAATGALANKLVPRFGQKIANLAANSAGGGLIGGGAEGLTRGYLNKENMLKTGLQDAGLGFTLGLIGGTGGGYIGKLAAKRGLYNNPLAMQSYLDDYIAGLDNNAPMGKSSRFSKELSEYQRLWQGMGKGSSEGQYLFAGENALNADINALTEAERMSLYEDAKNLDTWKQTGWFKGVDGKWRFEIPNGKLIDDINWQNGIDIDNKPFQSAKLPDVYDNPTFYEAYPEAKNLNIYLSDLGDKTGSYHELGQYIDLDKASNYRTADPEKLKLLEEIKQTPLYKKAHEFRSDKPFEEIKNDYMEYKNSDLYKREDELIQNLTIDGWNKEGLNSLQHELQHFIQSQENFARGGNSKSAGGIKNYNRLAGEVEARLAENRGLLTPEQMKEHIPFVVGDYGYDVAPTRQLLDKGYGVYGKGEVNKISKNNLYDKLIDNTVDLTNNFDKTPTIQEVKSHIKDLIDSGKVFDTLDDDWKIDVRGGNKKIKHLANSSQYEKMNKGQRNRHNKYVMSLENLINNSKYTNNPKVNTKLDKKPNIDTYHYFETNVKIGDKKYKVILNAEQYKGESTIKPQTVHLYDVLEIK